MISLWNRLERSIISGHTLSATLFSLAINMILKSAEIERREPMMKTGVRQSPIRAYIEKERLTATFEDG